MISRRGFVLGTLASGAIAAQPALPKIFQVIAPAYAGRAAVAYDPDVFPFTAGPGIKAIADKAKAGTKLETAKKLHSLLKVGAPGGLKTSDSGKTIKDDRPPRSPEETLKQGGDCSELAYVVLTAAKELGIDAGTITLDLGNDVIHLLPFVKIDGRKYIVDLQTDEFGKGTVEIGSERIAFAYESLGRGKPKLLWESSFEQSVGAWHMEWGNYLKESNKDPDRLKQAVAAFRKAIELNPADTHAKRKLDNASASLVNILIQKATKAFDGQYWLDAAELFEAAISYAPSTMSKAHKASLHENAAACRYNSGDRAAAADHYDEAFKLTGKAEYKASAADARK